MAFLSFIFLLHLMFQRNKTFITYIETFTLDNTIYGKKYYRDSKYT